jgi:hypothetical protein
MKKHNADTVNEVTKDILGFVTELGSTHVWSVMALKYIPGAKDKLVQRCVDVMVGSIKKYVGAKARREKVTFEQWQVHTALMKEMDFRLNKLFWGTYNDDRSCLDPEHWEVMQKVAVDLLTLLDHIKGEFYNVER